MLEFGESQLSEIRNFLLVWLALTIIIKRARGDNQRKVLANITPFALCRKCNKRQPTVVDLISGGKEIFNLFLLTLGVSHRQPCTVKTP